MTSSSLILGYVPGGTPAKWIRIWAERHPDVRLNLRALSAAQAADEVRTGSVDVALLRLPTDTSALAVIPLYEETAVAVLPTDHLLGAADVLTSADLDGEPILLPLDDVVAWVDAPGAVIEHRPETTSAAVELVAAGLGALIVPESLARLYHRRDLTYRPIADAPRCAVALAFREGQQSPLIEDFVGIVRGRTPGSSRGQSQPPRGRSPASRAGVGVVDPDDRRRAQSVPRDPGVSR